MKFLIVIGRNTISTYETAGKKITPQYIEGSDKFSYSVSNINEDMENYLEALANEKNLGTKAKLEFDVLEGTESFCNTGVIGALGQYIEKQYGINDALTAVIRKLSRDKALLIDQYGINYDGYSYSVKNGKLKKEPYNLLAYNVHSDDVISLMDF